MSFFNSVRVGLLFAVALSGEALVIELDDGQTILPGMFDLHAHYNYDLVGRAAWRRWFTRATSSWPTA